MIGKNIFYILFSTEIQRKAKSYFQYDLVKETYPNFSKFVITSKIKYIFLVKSKIVNRKYKIVKLTMKIIGITGTIGAGKGTIVDYLVSNYGFKHYSVRNFLTQEALKQNLPLNRDTYVAIANALRELHSPSYIIDELYKEAAKNGFDAIIESIRTPGEINSLRTKENFTLWAVDADPEIRYKRIFDRKSETDTISYETFLANEQREISTGDPTKQNLAECIRQADVVLNNNENFEELYKQIPI